METSTAQAGWEARWKPRLVACGKGAGQGSCRRPAGQVGGGAGGGGDGQGRAGRAWRRGQRWNRPQGSHQVLDVAGPRAQEGDKHLKEPWQEGAGQGLERLSQTALCHIVIDCVCLLLSLLLPLTPTFQRNWSLLGYARLSLCLIPPWVLIIPGNSLELAAAEGNNGNNAKVGNDSICCKRLRQPVKLRRLRSLTPPPPYPTAPQSGAALGD